MQRRDFLTHAAAGITGLAAGIGVGTSDQATEFTPRFSPRGGIRDQMIRAISQAKTRIRVLAYSFTCPDIVGALLEAHRHSIGIEIVLDVSNKTSPASKLVHVVAAGIPTWIDAKHAIMHNKVLIIDDRLAFTGSFNFSKSAEENNAENSVPVLQKAWVQAYVANFISHREHSQAAVVST